MPNESTEAIAAVLQEWPEVHGVAIEGLSEEVPNHPEYGEWFDESLLQTKDLTVTVYVPEDIPEAELRLRLRNAVDIVAGVGLDVGDAHATLMLGLVDEASWEEAWKKHFHPIPIGKEFVVVPKWEEESTDVGGRIPIVLEPGMAFGTGSHATTQLCLEALEQVDVEGKQVLDIGCGTAVLAIGAAKRGAAHVTAIDIDPVAVRVARDNAIENGVQDVVHAVEGDLLKGADEREYHVAFANILRDAVIALTPQALKQLLPGGVYIVSGFVTSQQEMVETALLNSQFSIQSRFLRDDWVAILAVKGS